MPAAARSYGNSSTADVKVFCPESVRSVHLITSESSRAFSTWADPGFDAIVGNPPYVRVQALNRWAPLDVKILRSRYQTARQGNYDL